MSKRLHDGQKSGWGRFFLDLDARLDSGVFQLGRSFRQAVLGFSAFMHGFRTRGPVRWLVVEPLSELATLGTAGAVLLLALAVPAFRETSEDWLKRSDIAVTFQDRYGNEVGSRGIRLNDSVPLEEFPDHLIRAVLATEDRRFYEHFGIDIAGTFRAMTANARAGGVVQGGSSLSQQLAKNLFLSNERTLERKVREAFLALWLETRLSKTEILKLYLDRAYMGGGAFGVDAAAHYYFGKSARDVTLSEAAMLAGLFKAPTKYAPHVNLPAARARANVVLDNLVEAGFMTEGQVFGARRNPASVVDRRDDRMPNYYLDWAFEEVRKIVEGFPRRVTERAFVVRTGLDLGLQVEAEKAVENALRQYEHEYAAHQAAAVVMELDGTVRAMVGGRDYGSSQFNRAVDSLRQPGSSFKPYVYAVALANGFKPSSVVVDTPICLGNWCPQNYGRSFSGSMTLTQALVRSINTIPIRLSVAVGDGNPKAGRRKIIDLAQKLGIRTPITDSSSLPIGAAEVTVLDHTAGFAAFANAGKTAPPHAAIEIRTGSGEMLWRFDRDGPKPVQVMPAQLAMDMNLIMNKVVEEGTGKRAMLDGIKAAGKTGTTNGYRDAWFVGFTGNFVGGVWFGNDDYSPTENMTGGSLPAMTWREIMTRAHQNVELRPIPGVPQGTKRDSPALLAAAARREENAARRSALTRRGSDVLLRVERLLEDAARVLPSPGTRARSADAGGSDAVAALGR